MSRLTNKLLVKAREYLAKGWVQGELRTDDGKVCLLGSLHRACEALTDEGDCVVVTDERLAIRAMEDCIQAGGFKFKSNDLHPLAEYNDAEGRTQEEVLAIADCAIERTKEQPDGNAAV